MIEEAHMKRYPVGKYIIDIPDDHKIVDIHKHSPLYDRLYGFILEEIGAAMPDGVIIDIGGNIGDTAAFISTYINNHIFSIEGNENFLNYFKSNLKYIGSSVTLIEKFINTDSIREGFFKYVESEGTGRLIPANKDDVLADNFISVKELLDHVKNLGNDICLVKSDTDGFDGHIIHEFLSRIDVPLFFECDTMLQVADGVNPWPFVFNLFNEKGYSIIVFDNFGLPMIIEENDPAGLLENLSGYLHLQRAAGHVRIHYLDVWAFPSAWKTQFRNITQALRGDLLKPYNF